MSTGVIILVATTACAYGGNARYSGCHQSSILFVISHRFNGMDLVSIRLILH